MRENDGGVKPASILVWVWLLILASQLSGATRVQAGESLELLRRPVNAALKPPAGEGLDWLHGAEPLGQGRFRWRAISRSHSVVIPGLGSGSVYTGIYALAYGLPAGLEASMALPLLLDAVGGLNRYGMGDPVLGIKFSRPSRIPAELYAACQLLVGLPLGNKKAHSLDDYGGGRSFSSEALDLGIQLLIDRHFEQLSVYLNGGYFRSGNPAALPEFAYGIGVEVGRRNRWLKLNGEYWTRVAVAQEARVAGVVKAGLRFSPHPGIEGEVGREYGLFDHSSNRLFTFGVRLHGRLTGGRRRMESRHVLYRPLPPERLYQPDQRVRLAVVDFAGFEDFKAGARLAERIRTHLALQDSLEVVDLKDYANVLHQGFLSSQQALELARGLGIDVVLTGEVAAYEVDRFAGPLIPFLIKLPETRVKFALRYRVLSFSPDRNEVESVVDQVAGLSRVSGGVELLPADERNITKSASARELHEAQEKALNRLASNLLAALAVRFSWAPPDFLP